MINVTKTYLPPLEEYLPYLSKIWKSGWVTNHGEMVIALEKKLKEYLGVKNLFLVANGTLALQIAIRVLGLRNSEVITTPFSYVASLNSLLWERVKPVLADINPENYTIEPKLILKKISSKTKAILPVHVYGIPAPVNKIQNIADEYGLKIIYDAAHAFGTKLDGEHLTNYGDVTCFSFHATKSFHTIEGGAIVIKDDNLASKVNWMRRFGHINDNYFGLGINAKMSELHAAIGLLNLEKFDDITKHRKDVWDYYKKAFANSPIKSGWNTLSNVSYNYAYFPVILDNQKHLKNKINELKKHNIFPRRYFFPSLSTLPHFKQPDCSIAENLSHRIICLPLYVGLEEEAKEKIVEVLMN